MHEFRTRNELQNEYRKYSGSNQGWESYANFQTKKKTEYKSMPNFEKQPGCQSMGFDHDDFRFVATRKVSLPATEPYGYKELISTPIRTETEFMIVMGERAQADICRLVAHREKYQEHKDKIIALEEDEKLRKQNPSLQKAWENYQTVKRLIK